MVVLKWLILGLMCPLFLLPPEQFLSKYYACILKHMQYELFTPFRFCKKNIYSMAKWVLLLLQSKYLPVKEWWKILQKLHVQNFLQKSLRFHDVQETYRCTTSSSALQIYKNIPVSKSAGSLGQIQLQQLDILGALKLA